MSRRTTLTPGVKRSINAVDGCGWPSSRRSPGYGGAVQPGVVGQDLLKPLSTCRCRRLRSSLKEPPDWLKHSPNGDIPRSEATTHTLISKGGDSTRAAPYAERRPNRSQRSTRNRFSLNKNPSFGPPPTRARPPLGVFSFATRGSRCRHLSRRRASFLPNAHWPVEALTGPLQRVTSPSSHALTGRVRGHAGRRGMASRLGYHAPSMSTIRWTEGCPHGGP